jgi:hypothetical protein
VFRVAEGSSVKPCGIELAGSRTLESCGPLSADWVGEGVVAGADGEDDAPGDELAVEQPAMREAAAAARPSRRGEREFCTETAPLSFSCDDAPGC